VTETRVLIKQANKTNKY